MHFVFFYPKNVYSTKVYTKKNYIFSFQLSFKLKISSSLEVSTVYSKNKSETMSDYAESYVSDCEVDPEELKNQSLFDKPRGVPRWLGKPHNSVKERLHNSVKDRTFIQKTVSSSEPLSRVSDFWKFGIRNYSYIIGFFRMRWIESKHL